MATKIPYTVTAWAVAREAGKAPIVTFESQETLDIVVPDGATNTDAQAAAQWLFQKRGDDAAALGNWGGLIDRMRKGEITFTAGAKTQLPPPPVLT
jgi:hypothetical protein